MVCIKTLNQVEQAGVFMKMTNLSSLFSGHFKIDADFYLTENDFRSQRFLFEGMRQLSELSQMKKAGMFDFETVLLLCSDASSPKPVDFSGEILKNLTPDSVAGFVLIERQSTSASGRNDSGTCLVFTPIVSDSKTKGEFFMILKDLILPPLSSFQQLEILSSDLFSDVIEYYAETALSFFKESGTLPPYDSVYSKSRVQKAACTIQKTEEISGRRFLFSGSDVLEICCGNGMSTLALYEKNISPICVDINAEDICIGLSHGVLNPNKTIIADASALSQNFDENSFDAVVGFMIGTIYEFNKNLWFSIVEEAVKMLKPNGFLLLTLRSKIEAIWISDFLKEKGIIGEIFDNRDDLTNYDEWIYSAVKN